MSGFFGSITGRRKLPDRSTAQSRSLDYPGGVGPMETVLEAGRGVRKLPPQPGTSTLTRGGPPGGLWQNGGSTAMMNGNLSMPHQGPNGQLPQQQGPMPMGPHPMDMGPPMMGPTPMGPTAMGPQVGPHMGPMGSMEPPQGPMPNGMMNPVGGNGYLPGTQDAHMQMMPQQPEWT